MNNAQESADDLVADVALYRPQRTSTPITPERWERFFLALADFPNVSRACRAAGFSRHHAYKDRREKPEIAARWDDALQIGIDSLEAAGMERVKDKQSDLLTIFYLKALRPAVYSEKAQAEAGGKLSIEIVHRFPNPSDPEPIEVESRAVMPESHQLTDGQNDPIGVTLRKD